MCGENWGPLFSKPKPRIWSSDDDILRVDGWQYNQAERGYDSSRVDLERGMLRLGELLRATEIDGTQNGELCVNCAAKTSYWLVPEVKIFCIHIQTKASHEQCPSEPYSIFPMQEWDCFSMKNIKKGSIISSIRWIVLGWRMWKVRVETGDWRQHHHHHHYYYYYYYYYFCL